MNNNDDIDLGFVSIIEAMLDDNTCEDFEENGVFCDNTDKYYEDNFFDIHSLRSFIENSNKVTCN